LQATLELRLLARAWGACGAMIQIKSKPGCSTPPLRADGTDEVNRRSIP
jgi:hypothetical protein